jgi:N-acyl amino acid synthase of PEP-CTERM/exosortase system
MLEHEYDFYLSDTNEGKSIHFALRYQVYCLREKYEDPSRHQNHLEQDAFDGMSAHFIARSRITGEWLGAMRLIIGPAQNLPVTHISTVNLSKYSDANGHNVAEASRLCTLVPTHLRSNLSLKKVNSSPHSVSSQKNGSRTLQTSYISLGLIRAARQYCLQNDITYCFFLISDPLARMLRRLGMEIQVVGSPCQHRGWRSPYIHNVRTGYQAMSVRSPELYKTFCHANAYAFYSELEEKADHTEFAAIA